MTVKGKFKSRIGERFGRLLVIDQYIVEDDYGKSRTYCKCLCDCGNTTIVRADSLVNGNTNSCGCIERNVDLSESKYFVNGTLITAQGLMTKANKSGVVGVNWDKSRNKWQASLRYKGKKYNLGRFNDFYEAVKVRKAAEKKYFEKFKDKTGD